MQAHQWGLLCSLLLASHLTFSNSTARQRRSHKRPRKCLLMHLPLLITPTGTGKVHSKTTVMELPRIIEGMAHHNKHP